MFSPLPRMPPEATPLVHEKSSPTKLPVEAGTGFAGKAAPRPDLRPNRSAPGKGPWGQIDRVPFFLEAPQHLIERFPLPNPKPRWFATAAEASQVLDRLVRAGLPGDLLQAINQPANRAIVGDQIVFFPPALSVLQLPPEVRASIYRELRRFPANVDMVGPVVIANNDVDDWFSQSRLRPELVASIKRMCYQRGDALVFSDAAVLMGHVQGETEARLLARALSRTRTLMAKLVFDGSSKVADMTAYWTTGPNRRMRNIGAILQSIAALPEGNTLDLAHLLPGLARNLLFSYPDVSMVAHGQVPDCHWTSLNFFKPTPEPLYLDNRIATSVVLESYNQVKPPYHFGDLLVFLDSLQGNAFHSCIYIADDILFTKNGRNLLSPWVFQSLDHLKKTYLFENNGRIQGYRAKESLGVL